MKRILIVFLAVLLNGCLGTKKVTESTQKTQENKQTEVKKDSASVIETNQGIKDRITINVPETDNGALEKSLDAILRQLNTSKSSGSNSYVSRYDEETRQLVIDFIIAQTQNKETVKSEEKTTEESKSEYVEDRIFKKVSKIPWWVYLVIGIWFLPQIITRINMLINPVGSLINRIKNDNREI